MGHVGAARADGRRASPGPCGPRAPAGPARAHPAPVRLQPVDAPTGSPYLVLLNSVREFVGEADLLPSVRLVGAAPSAARRTVDFPRHRLDDRPLVLASLGTVAERLGSRFFRALADALADEPVQVVAAAGPELLPAPPANFVVQPYVPQLELMERAGAVVSHAGHNSVVEALAHGRPLAVAPIAYDQPFTAARVVTCGAGLRVRFARPRAAELREAVRPPRRAGVRGERTAPRRGAAAGGWSGGRGRRARGARAPAQAAGGRRAVSRILFVAPPLLGHVAPAASVSAELARRGHETAWVASEQHVGRALPAKARRYDAPVAAAIAEQLEQPLRGGIWESLRRFWFGVAFPLARDMAPAVERALDDFEPDALVSDQHALAGAVATPRRRSLPWATSAATPQATSPVVNAIGGRGWLDEHLAELHREAGFEPAEAADLSPELVLVYSSAELAGAGTYPASYRFVGPPLDEAAGEDEAFPWQELREGPRLYVTLGAAVPARTAALRHGVRGPGRRAAAGRRGRAARVDRQHAPERARAPVGAAARADRPGRRRPLPRRPQHRRPGALAGQAARARPRLLRARAHRGPGHRRRSGAARPLRPADPSDLRTAVRRVLAEPSFAEHAERVGGSLRAAGGAPAAADAVEELAASSAVFSSSPLRTSATSTGCAPTPTSWRHAGTTRRGRRTRSGSATSCRTACRSFRCPMSRRGAVAPTGGRWRRVATPTALTGGRLDDLVVPSRAGRSRRSPPRSRNGRQSVSSWTSPRSQGGSWLASGVSVGVVLHAGTRGGSAGPLGRGPGVRPPTARSAPA